MKPVYTYTDSKGEPTTNIVEIVTQEIELLAYTYIENNGVAPTKAQIDTWTYTSLKVMGWYDD